MPKTFKRSRRISDLIQREIANLIRTQIKDPRLAQVAVTDVHVTDDLHLAKVYYALLNPEKLAEVKAALTKASGFLRHELAHNLKLRYIPEVLFYYDESSVRAQRISELLDRVLPDEEEKGSE